MQNQNIQSYTRQDLSTWLEQYNIKPYRANQIFKWIYLKQADSFDVMTDLNKNLRDLLSAHFHIQRLKKQAVEISCDGTRKYLFKLYDNRYIESVFIPESKRTTLCISTQVGCAQNCQFCLTAKGGFIRNLKNSEIISQIRDVQNDILKNNLKQYITEDNRTITNIVLMGMGEPLANYDNVILALKTITDSDFGLQFSNRRVTISTSGIVPKMKDLGKETKINLAVSLNAADNKTRSILMPINKTYPIEQLLEACRNYPLSPRQKITFEYILIKGINDSVKDAYNLIKLLRPIKSKINLIPFNEHAGSEFKRPDEKTINTFLQILCDNHYTAIIRQSKGDDISAACGQLKANQIVD